MATEVIIALIGVASTIISWVLGRRRTDADIASMQMDYIKKADNFYNKRIDDLQAEVERQADQIKALKITIDKMINDACLVKQCSRREYYTPELLAEIVPKPQLKDETKTE